MATETGFTLLSFLLFILAFKRPLPNVISTFGAKICSKV